MPLVNRGKKSIVIDVLQTGRDKNAGQLVAAVTGYFNAAREKSYKIEQDGSLGRDGIRGRAVKAILEMEAELVRLRKVFDAALEEFDINARELEAWETAAQAAARVTGETK